MTTPNNSCSELCFADWIKLQSQLASIKENIKALMVDDKYWRYGIKSYRDHESFYPQMRDLLVPFSERQIYLTKIEESEPNWRGENSWCAHVCLTIGEAEAYRANLLASNSRDFRNKLRRDVAVEPVPIGELFERQELLKLLDIRLKGITPYATEQIPANPEWLWVISGYEHWNLLVIDCHVITPNGWDITDYEYGEISIKCDLFKVTNSKGQSGLVYASGQFATACEYGRLSKPIEIWGDGGCYFEVAETADSIVSDLMNVKGKQINPETVRIITGSESGGIWRLLRVGGDDDGPLGYMNIKGELLGDICWRDGLGHWGGFAAVQSDESGLWGYIDRQGTVVIEPCYQSAGSFNASRAFVQGESGMGIIDTEGNVIFKPVWRRISWFDRDHFIIELTDCKVGIVDMDGKYVLPLADIDHDKDITVELGKSLANESKLTLQQAMSDAIRRCWKDLVNSAVELNVIEGIFKNGDDELRLQLAGLWENRVELLEPYHVGGRTIAKGEQGTIGFHHPVTSSLFDFSVEAPAYGFGDYPDQCVGVPWKILARVTV